MLTIQANNQQATATTTTARIFTTIIPWRTDDDEIDLVQQKGPIYKFVFSGIDRVYELLVCSTTDKW